MFRKNLNGLDIQNVFTEFNNHLHTVNPLVGLSRGILNLLWYPPCVGIVTGLCAEWSGVSFLAEARNFSPLQSAHTGSGSPSLLFNGYLMFFPWG
jgi:hypothetical protein